MMTDFVERYRNGAGVDRGVLARSPSEHFARTPIAQKFGLRDLNWFFRQWVYGTELPSYTLEYQLKAQPTARSMICRRGEAGQRRPDWLMVLPVVLTFDGNQEARTTVRATGPSTPFELKLPAKPRKVELDPVSWVLSEKTMTRGK